MGIRLSENAFIRQIGSYTYIVNQLNDADFLFEDADVFFRFLTRKDQEERRILSLIANSYKIKEEDIFEDVQSIYQALKHTGIILDSETEEPKFSYTHRGELRLEGYTKQESSELAQSSRTSPLSQLHKYFREMPVLFDLKIDLTQACTERCLHCYVPNYTDSFLPYGKLIEILDEASEMGTLKISFSGGECMLHPDIEKILRYARKKDFIISILSNLTLCDDAMIAVLKDIRPYLVQTSLYAGSADIHDGITKRHGSFQETMNAIYRLHDANIPLQINCPIMKQNCEDFENVLKIGEHLKIKVMTNDLIMGRADGALENLKHQMNDDDAMKFLSRKYRNSPAIKPSLQAANGSEYVCSIGIMSLNLHSNGNYYPCNGGYKLIAGNCYTQSLRDVWEKSSLLKQLRSLRMKDFPKCSHCIRRSVCKICPSLFFTETDSLFTPSENTCRNAYLKMNKN